MMASTDLPHTNIKPAPLLSLLLFSIVPRFAFAFLQRSYHISCPCRAANKRCTSCACFNNCQNKRAPLPPPTIATLCCFFTSLSAAATTEPTPAVDSNQHPATVPLATERVPTSTSHGIPTINNDDGDD